MIMAAATALSLAAQASASFTLTVTPVALTNATLLSNGWSGYRLTLVADGSASTGVNSMDFTNHVTGFTDGGSVGITGPVHQAWVLDVSSGDHVDDLPTPLGFTTTATTPAIPTGASSALFDSFWNSKVPANTSGYAYGNDAAEDNTGNGSPLADQPADVGGGTNGIDFGVGNLMTEAVAIKVGNGQVAPLTYNLAFVIAKPGANNVSIRGVVLDPQGNQFTISSIINPGAVLTPEPASLGLLGVAGIGLLARRRK